MKDKIMKSKPQNIRRKVLLGLTGGVVATSQLPGVWKKPIVNAVLLPSHAQTSTPTEYSGDAVGFQETVQNRPISLFISEAYAGGSSGSSPNEVSSQIYINTENAPMFTATVSTLVEHGHGNHHDLYSATGTIGGSPVDLTHESGCDYLESNISLEVSTAGATVAYVLLASDGPTHFISSGELSPGTNIPVGPGRCAM